jgi:TolB-like protein
MLQVDYTLVQVSHPRSLNMKKVLLLLAFLLLFLHPSYSISFRIALSDFAVHSKNPNYEFMGKGISEMIAVELAKATGVNLIDRERRAEVLEEIEFALSDLADATKQVEVGKMLAAKYLVFGEIIDMDKEVLTSLRMIDVESTMVVWNEQVVSRITNYDYITGYFTVSILEHLGLPVPSSTIAKVEAAAEKNEDAVVAFSRAVDAYDRKENAEATEELARARRIDPDNEAVRAYLSKLLVNLSKFKVEAAAMQLPSQNPAYLGILQYAQLSVLCNMGMPGQLWLLESYDLKYGGGAPYHIIAAYSLPLWRRFGAQTNLFVHHFSEDAGNPTDETEWNSFNVSDWGVQLNLGWAATDLLSFGIGASVFLEVTKFDTPVGVVDPPSVSNLKSAFCLGILFKNPESTLLLDILSGFSFGRQYLLHAEELRDYIYYSGPKYSFGDSVILPMLVEATLTYGFRNRRVFLVLRQRNDIDVERLFYTGRLTPALEVWIAKWFSMRGGLELSIHKTGDVFTYGIGGVGGIGFRSVRHAWDFELGGSYRIEPIQSIPGEVIYEPNFYINITKNLLSKPRQS